MMNCKLFLFCFVCLTCKMTAQLTGYDLNAPYRMLTLPDTLREVSDITVTDKQTIACVQDENGIVFIYDLVQNRIKKQYVFAANGDYEGIASVGDTLYVLRSDGVLFETAEGKKTHTYPTGIPAVNNEGLCYDQAHHRLLIACKSKSGKGPAYKDHRQIYGFDLHRKCMSEEPVFNFSISTVKQFLATKEYVLPAKEKKNGRKEALLKFTMSAIAIHPFSGKLFLISSTDHLLFVADFNGTLEQVARLDPFIFNKPEGIGFLENGDLLITNEGQQKKPSLLWFRYSH